MFKFTFKTIGVFFFFCAPAIAQCTGVFKDVPIVSKLATSSTYANFRGSADSLKVMSKELMMQAVNGSAGQPPADFACPTGCKVKSSPEIVFSSTPNKYLVGYTDEKICQELKEKTLKSPIEYKNRVFPNLEDLNTYYSDLCRGSGTDGKDLYKICHSSCSPAYKSIISKVGTGYQMDTEIICGDARDKSEGMYVLSSSYRWACEPS